MRMLGMLGALAVIWIGFTLLSGGVFLTPRNLWNLSVQTASVAIMATGMVLVIVTRNIDLSVGAILGVVGMIIGVAAGAVAAGLSRPRALAHRAARRAHRRHGRRAHRPVPGLAHRLSRHSLLHRHPRRPAGVARRGLVGHDGPDHRAHGHALQGLRRRRGRRARRHRHLGHRGDRLRRHRRRAWASPAAAACASASRCVPVWADAVIAGISCVAVLGAAAIANAYPLPAGTARRWAEANGIAWPEGGLFIPHGVAVAGADRGRASVSS